MLFSEESVECLRDDPVRGTIAFCDKAIAELGTDSQEGWSAEDYSVLLETYSLLLEVMESGLLPIRVTPPSLLGTGGSQECQQLYQWVAAVRTQCVAEESKLRITSFRNRFRASLGAGFVYEFSQGDLDRIQTLVDQLRQHLATTDELDKEHQQRLLRRLERLQTELHKKVSDLDRFWGLIGDAGVVIGKLGTDAKPIVDRIREVTDIVWRTQSRAEELPSGTKLPQLEGKPTDVTDDA